ncbi:MAG: aminoacyl--tRNA ligase-related protein [Candidatus Bathyarchaeia archaeon]
MKNELRMHARVVLGFSDNLERARESLKRAIEEANKTILLKGAPQGHEDEGARITSWKVKGRSMELEIDSGTFVRATSAALRMKRHLGNMLGREHRIGVRELRAEMIELTIPVEDKIGREAASRIKAIPSVSGVEYQTGKIRVKIGQMGEHDLKNNVPDRILTRVRSVLSQILKPAATTQPTLIVKRGETKQVRFDKDPVQSSIDLGWIKEFPGRGQWIYTTPYSQLFNIIREILLEEVAHNLSFQPFMLPKLIPLEVMKKMPGYLDDIPEGMYYCFPPPRDPEAFSDFKETMKITREVSREQLKKALKDPEYVLAPAQCEPFWQFYAKETFNQDDYPFKLYDASGWTYRWEGGGVEGMVRLHEFQRIELTYLGTPRQVTEIRDSILDRCIYVADKHMDMEWRVTAAIPFWAREGELDMNVQESEKVPAYDLEIYLPYRGSRETSEWLEVAGCFIHRRKFIESFGIGEVKNRETWTGCTGLGLTRWVAAFLATHGFEPDEWPRDVKMKFKRDYKLPKSLLWPPRKR